MRWVVVAAGLVLAACNSPASSAVEPAPAPQVVEAPPPAPPPEPARPKQSDLIDCAGPATQGGAIVCRTDPGSVLSLNGAAVAVAINNKTHLPFTASNSSGTVTVTGKIDVRGISN